MLNPQQSETLDIILSHVSEALSLTRLFPGANPTEVCNQAGGIITNLSNRLNIQAENVVAIRNALVDEEPIKTDDEPYAPPIAAGDADPYRLERIVRDLAKTVGYSDKFNAPINDDFEAGLRNRLLEFILEQH